MMNNSVNPDYLFRVLICLELLVDIHVLSAEVTELIFFLHQLKTEVC